MSCSHVVMLWYDIIHDVIWHVLRVYKRPGAVPWGDSLVQPPLGKEVHMCMPRLMRWCTRALTEPTSFKYNWVVTTCLCVPASVDAPIHFESGPGTPCSTLSTVSTGLSCLSVGACVHYLSSCLHLRKRSTRGQDLLPHGVAHITYISRITPKNRKLINIQILT